MINTKDCYTFSMTGGAALMAGWCDQYKKDKTRQRRLIKWNNKLKSRQLYIALTTKHSHLINRRLEVAA